MQELQLKQVKPTGTIDEIFEIDCVADSSERQRNIDHAATLKVPRVHWRKKRKGKVAIVASGPSASDCIDFLKDFDGEIWGINRSFEWLRHRGVKPTAFLGVDPEWFLVESIPNPPKDATLHRFTSPSRSLGSPEGPQCQTLVHGRWTNQAALRGSPHPWRIDLPIKGSKSCLRAGLPRCAYFWRR